MRPVASTRYIHSGKIRPNERPHAALLLHFRQRERQRVGWRLEVPYDSANGLPHDALDASQHWFAIWHGENSCTGRQPIQPCGIDPLDVRKVSCDDIDRPTPLGEVTRHLLPTQS